MKDKVAIARKLAAEILEDTDFMSVVEYLEEEGLDSDEATDIHSIIIHTISGELGGK